MIVGLGTDIIEVERIRDAVDRHEEHFLRHVFTDAELRDAPERNGRYAFYAGRWAAKEAVSKALGTGIGASCAWTDIEIRNNGDGKPEVVLNGRAAETASTLGAVRAHISISHERALACAVAVLESEP